MKLLFVTDIHGSEICFRKFLSAVIQYRADAALLLGDLSGKVIMPIRRTNGTYTCILLGKTLVAHDETELQSLQRKNADMGYYSYVASQSEIEELQQNPARNDEIFRELIVERLTHWTQYADEKLRDSPARVYIGPGNDDPFVVDAVLDHSKRMVNLTERVVDVHGYEVVTTAFSNPTPWHTPRECTEEELRARIDHMVSKVERVETAIFNFHVPPYGTLLDIAPELKALQPVVGSTSNVGSTAVAGAIRKYQPLLGLHGHIHESKAAEKIGRTICVNPGSEYAERVLRGILITLDKDEVKNYIFTSG
jgi:hypothetical protein